jgi:hypothetical protein
MNCKMKKCTHRDNQEQCDDYKEKCDIPGKVNMDCIYFRRGYLDKYGGSICTAPPKEK